MVFARKDVSLVGCGFSELYFDFFSEFNVCTLDCKFVLISGVVVGDTKVQFFERSLPFYLSLHLF